MRQLRDTTYRRSNRDEIRALFGDSSLALTSHFEYEVTKVQHDMILAGLRKGHSVIVDDTNLTKRGVDRFRDLVQKYCNESGRNVGFETKMFPVELKTCIERDKKRGEAGGRTVGEEVIKKMHKRFGSGASGSQAHIKDHYELLFPMQSNNVQDKSLPKCIIIDIDGTAAIVSHRLDNIYDASDCENDPVNVPVINTVKLFQEKGYKIFFFSGRSDAYEEQTKNWMELNGITYDKLVMRKDGDVRKDSILKEEMYNHHVKNDYYVEFILDDRNQVVDKWRSMGLTVFQVAYGDF